jgi:hypothetical protein
VHRIFPDAEVKVKPMQANGKQRCQQKRSGLNRMLEEMFEESDMLVSFGVVPAFAKSFSYLDTGNQIPVLDEPCRPFKAALPADKIIILAPFVHAPCATLHSRRGEMPASQLISLLPYSSDGKTFLQQQYQPSR